MRNWQLTATTILCAISGAEVTVTVHKDGRLSCTGQIGQSLNERTGASPCKAQYCTQIKTYQAKLLAEENNE
jgi:hypothetical protein